MATLATWTGTTDPFTHGAGGTATLESGPEFPGDWVDVTRTGSGTFYAEWAYAAGDQRGCRFYFRAPAAWPGSSATLATLGAAGTSPRFVLAGSGSPGQVRLVGVGGVQLATSPVGALQSEVWYRGELQVNVATNETRAAVFPLQSDTPIWASAWTLDTVNTPQDVARLGAYPSGSPAVGTTGFARLVVVDDVTGWVGRAVGDDLPPVDAALFEWDAAPAPEIDGTGGTVSVAASGSFPHAQLVLVHDGTSVLAAGFDPITPELAVRTRSYVKMPGPIWPQLAHDIIACLDGFSATARVTVSGQGQPGRVRLTGPGGTTIAESDTFLVSPGRWYRFELLNDIPNGRARLGVFGIGSTRVMWDSGWQTADFGSQITTVRVGVAGGGSPMGEVRVGGIRGDKDVSGFMGRHEDDAAVPLDVSYWDGATEHPVTVSYWDGATERPLQAPTLP